MANMGNVFRVEQYPDENYPGNPHYMRYAFKGGESCLENGDLPISALITKTKEYDDKLFEYPLADGRNEVESSGDFSRTAVMQALQKACALVGRSGLVNCVLYTNHEPDEMSTGAITHSKLAGVIFSTSYEDIPKLFSDDLNLRNISPRVPAEEIIRGRQETGLPPQFVISGFLYDEGMSLFRKNGLLIGYKPTLVLNQRQPQS